SGTSVADLGVAVNKSKKTESGDYVDETSFFDVSVYGNFADLVARKLSKGSAVVVQGELKQDRWENQEGENRSKVKINARQIDGPDMYRKAEDTPAATPTSSQSDDIPF
ncbi:MAG TPA: single-stranded DNA-binding protein, partial [Gemmatimonadales bacterium]|nr:single-stranded DNA-binding protein [Gemmatimonadales bacterium]